MRLHDELAVQIDEGPITRFKKDANADLDALDLTSGAAPAPRAPEARERERRSEESFAGWVVRQPIAAG